MTFHLRKTLEILFSLLLAITILYWIYKDFPLSKVMFTLQNDTRWGWLLFSLLFGIFPQILRGIRWRMALEPLGERPSRRHCISAIYMSFAASLVIPRIGEISRCATLKKTDNTSFPVALGTVVTERIIDSLLVLLILILTFICEIPTFIHFFKNIGFDPTHFFSLFTLGGCIVTIVCLAAIILGGIFFFRRFAVLHRFKDVFNRFIQGVASIRKVRNLPLYFIYTFLIWTCYFLHFFLSFYAFGFTSQLGIKAGLLAFCMITVAVLVPTPNGAGPWHFAVKVVLMQFGLTAANAILFALIVHAMQTLLVILLGFYGYVTLLFTSRLHSPKEILNNDINTTSKQ